MTQPMNLFTPHQLPSGADGCYHIVDPLAPILVFAHGAGASFEHSHMTHIATTLATEGINTLRFNLPFMQAGKRRVDGIDVSIAAIREAVETASMIAPNAPKLLGGHSFGGRMATHLAAADKQIAQALVLFSFPLHASKKPSTKRADHLGQVSQPTLFLSGTRDTLADQPLLQQVTSEMSQATLHWLDTADHSFKILKRTRQSKEDVYAEAARIAAFWIKQNTSPSIKP